VKTVKGINNSNTLSLLAEIILDNSLRESNIKWLKESIDLSLDDRNENDFMYLTDLLNEVNNEILNK
jgi:uncharacterized protein YpiB (UPF0302 family)